MEDKLSDVLHKNVHVGIMILVDKALCNDHCNYTEQLIATFITNLAAIYGNQMLIYNVHTFGHLASHCRVYMAV